MKYKSHRCAKVCLTFHHMTASPFFVGGNVTPLLCRQSSRQQQWFKLVILLQLHTIVGKSNRFQLSSLQHSTQDLNVEPTNN